jgi:hypothetical protein
MFNVRCSGPEKRSASRGLGGYINKRLDLQTEANTVTTEKKAALSAFVSSYEPERDDE